MATGRTEIPIGLIEDSSLSFAARGIFAYIKSLPPDAEYNLTQNGKCGKWAIKTALSELVQKGWLPKDTPILRRYYAKDSIPDAIRWEVWERDNFTCLHCGIRRFLTVDHIEPESKGGSLELSNLQTLCKRCNSIKGVKVTKGGDNA